MRELQHEQAGGEAGVQVPLLPAPEQVGLLNRTFGSVRYVYNRALAERSRAWTREQRRVTFAETCRMLTAWKIDPDTAWLYEVSNVALQQGLQHLQHAYVSFWAKRARYPGFKSKRKSRASATFTASGFRYRDGQVWLAKLSAPLAIAWSRPLPRARSRPRSPCRGTRRAGGTSRSWPSARSRRCPGHHGGGGRRGDHLAGHAVDGGEGHQPRARAPRPGPAREDAAGAVPHAERLREPGQSPDEGREGARPDHRPPPRPWCDRIPNRVIGSPREQIMADASAQHPAPLAATVADVMHPPVTTAEQTITWPRPPT